MTKKTRFALLTLTVLSFFGSGVVHGETILKFDLGNAGMDFELVGTTLSTIDDGDPGTAGDQNTNVNFTGFLDSMPDISADVASFSLNNVVLDGPASTILSAVVVQPTVGGTFSLWDNSDSLLIAGTIADGSVVGSLGSSAAGAFANLTLGTFTGGSLLPLLDADSLALAISFTDVNDGGGFSLDTGVLQPFNASGTGNISAVPEPSGIALLALGFLVIGATKRSRS